jgi:hypothetical protein
MKKLLIIALSVSALSACKKEPDSPPENLLNQNKIITIDSLRSWQQANSPGGVSITDSLNLYAIVTMDEAEGNIYKNLYIEDHTAAIQVRLTSSSDFAVGDSIRFSLAGAYLSEYAGVIQLDSIDPETMMVKQSAGHPLTPTVVTISELDSVFTNDIQNFTDNYEGKLIQLNNVQVTFADLSKTWADAFNQSSENIILEDCSGNNIIVRTSGFADFANETVPDGNGSIVCIVGRFNSDIQLTIRSISEVDMAGTRCAGQILSKDFEDEDLFSGGWTNIVVVGTTAWEVQFFGSNCAVISNYDGMNNSAAESWLISPALDLSNTTTATMSFDNDCNYSGDPLQLLVSADYAGVGNPNSSTWIDISSSVTWDSNPSGWGFEPTGDIDLSAYTGGTLYVAFKYTGSNSDGRTWEIDNIIITG